VGILYFNTLIREIRPAPRKVKYSGLYAKAFPAEDGLKIRALIQKVKRGDDLRPHQSRRLVNRKLLQNDGMLNDWSVHHLHPDANGSGEVLMCHVTPDTLYAIGFWPHDSWVSKDIIVALIDAWPKKFERYRMKGLDSDGLTEAEHQNLRRKNANTLFVHPTRGTYAPLGGGTTAAGSNIAATTEYDLLATRVQGIEEQTQQQLEKLGVAETSRLVLKFDGHEPIAVFEPSTSRTFPLLK